MSFDQGDEGEQEAVGVHEDPQDPGSNVLRDVSRRMVRLYKEQFGRGPESVSTHFSGPDTIVSIVNNSLSPVERAMRDMGEQQRLRELRLMFQHATEPKFRAAVEEATGRRVIAFMSGIDVEEDTASEVFTLEPRGGSAPETRPDRATVAVSARCSPAPMQHAGLAG